MAQLESSPGDINSPQIVQVSWVSTTCATKWRHLPLSWHCVSSRPSTSQWWMRSALGLKVSESGVYLSQITNEMWKHDDNP